MPFHMHVNIFICHQWSTWVTHQPTSQPVKSESNPVAAALCLVLSLSIYPAAKLSNNFTPDLLDCSASVPPKQHITSARSIVGTRDTTKRARDRHHRRRCHATQFIYIGGRDSVWLEEVDVVAWPGAGGARATTSIYTAVIVGIVQ